MKKCLPVLLYGIEVCSLSKSNISDLDFAVTNTIMKIFKTKSRDVANVCADMFGVNNVNDIIQRRKKNFLTVFQGKGDIFGKIFHV